MPGDSAPLEPVAKRPPSEASGSSPVATSTRHAKVSQSKVPQLAPKRIVDDLIRDEHNPKTAAVIRDLAMNPIAEPDRPPGQAGALLNSGRARPPVRGTAPAPGDRACNREERRPGGRGGRVPEGQRRPASPVRGEGRAGPRGPAPQNRAGTAPHGEKPVSRGPRSAGGARDETFPPNIIRYGTAVTTTGSTATGPAHRAQSPDSGSVGFGTDEAGELLAAERGQHHDDVQLQLAAPMLTAAHTESADGRVPGSDRGHTYDDPAPVAGFTDCATNARLPSQARFAAGRLADITDSSGVTYLSYDMTGRLLLRVEQRNGAPCARVTRWTYDSATGRLTSQRYPSGRSVTYYYNNSGDPLQVTDLDRRQRAGAVLRPEHPVPGHPGLPNGRRPADWSTSRRTS